MLPILVAKPLRKSFTPRYARTLVHMHTTEDKPTYVSG